MAMQQNRREIGAGLSVLAWALVLGTPLFIVPGAEAQEKPALYRLVAPRLVAQNESFTALVVTLKGDTALPLAPGNLVNFSGVVVEVEQGGKVTLPPLARSIGASTLAFSLSKTSVERTLPDQCVPHELTVCPQSRGLSRISSTSKVVAPGVPFRVRGNGLNDATEGALIGTGGIKSELGSSVGSSLERVFPYGAPAALLPGKYSLVLSNSKGSQVISPTAVTRPRITIAGKPVDKLGERGTLTVTSDTDTGVLLTGGAPQLNLDKHALKLKANTPQDVGFTAEETGPSTVDAHAIDEDEDEEEGQENPPIILCDTNTGGGGAGVPAAPPEILPDCCISRLVFTNDTQADGSYEIYTNPPRKTLAKSDAVKPGHSVAIIGGFGKCVRVKFTSKAAISDMQICCEGIGERAMKTKDAGLLTFSIGSGTCGEEDPPRVIDLATDPDDKVQKLGIYLKRDNDKWLPANPSTTTVTARIYEKRASGKWTPSTTPRVIHFYFKSRSNEKGECLNSGEQTTPDLYFDMAANPDMECEDSETKYCGKAKTKKAVTLKRLKVSCEDFGAFSEIGAKATEDCVRLERSGDDFNEIDEPLVKVPKDDDNNQIADAFEDAVGRHPLGTEDDDPYPEGKAEGDGFSTYEEYRGFRVDGGGPGGSDEHIRTAWLLKDLFIHDRDGLGLGVFPEASKITCHLIKEKQYKSDKERIVNFNRGHHKLQPDFDQHGLWLVNEVVGGGGAGDSLIGPPKKVGKVRVDRKKFKPGDAGQAGADHAIAHELGHATGISHHGTDSPNDFHEEELHYSAPGVEKKKGLFYSSDKSIFRGGDSRTVLVGYKGNNTSGDEDCIMIYQNPWKMVVYEFNGDYEKVPNSAYRASKNFFCSAKHGHQYNADGHMAGEAKVGNCKGQIIVNDK